MRIEVHKKDTSFQKLQKQFSQEYKNTSNGDLLDQKDAIIVEQAEKISSLKQELGKLRADGMQYMQARHETDLEKRYQHAKNLFQNQKKENELIVQREHVSQAFVVTINKQHVLKLTNIILTSQHTSIYIYIYIMLSCLSVSKKAFAPL